MPNIILPMFCGILLSKIGNSKGLLLYAFLCLLGQTVCGLGGYFDSFGLLITGRIIYGLGGETI